METQDQTSHRPNDSTPLDQPFTIPIPLTNERPILYADRVGEWYVTQKSNKHRKLHGLYLTPVQVAEFMAKQIRVASSKLRVLDPAAGSGILVCAAVEALVARPDKPATLAIITYEVDPELIPPLRAVVEYLIQWCRANFSVKLTARVEPTDFVLAHAEALRSFSTLLPYEPDHHDFDIVIANPPYFKINKQDPRAVAAASVVHGQPNIYGLFGPRRLHFHRPAQLCVRPLFSTVPDRVLRNDPAYGRSCIRLTPRRLQPRRRTAGELHISRRTRP